MRVGELREGALLTTVNNFTIWTSGGGLLRFIRWHHAQGKMHCGPLLYLGNKPKQKSLHNVLYRGNICYIDSADFRYLGTL